MKFGSMPSDSETLTCKSPMFETGLRSVNSKGPGGIFCSKKTTEFCLILILALVLAKPLITGLKTLSSSGYKASSDEIRIPLTGTAPITGLWLEMAPKDNLDFKSIKVLLADKSPVLVIVFELEPALIKLDCRNCQFMTFRPESRLRNWPLFLMPWNEL